MKGAKVYNVPKLDKFTVIHLSIGIIACYIEYFNECLQLMSLFVGRIKLLNLLVIQDVSILKVSKVMSGFKNSHGLSNIIPVC